MTIHIMIPARYQSSRLPGKVLLPIQGKSMLAHVYDRAKEADVGRVVILTDDTRVKETADTFCDEVLLTSKDCQSGTDRIIEAIQTLGIKPNDIIINLQADEPFIEPDKIHQLCDMMDNKPDVVMATLAHEIDDLADLTNPNVVKVVLNKHSEAMYFSRSMIPWADNQSPGGHLRHIGLYAYRAEFLLELQLLDMPDMQLKEKLEQLKVLWHGFPIHVGVCDKPRYTDINTEEDYQNLLSALK